MQTLRQYKHYNTDTLRKVILKGLELVPKEYSKGKETIHPNAVKYTITRVLDKTKKSC